MNKKFKIFLLSLFIAGQIPFALAQQTFVTPGVDIQGSKVPTIHDPAFKISAGNLPLKSFSSKNRKFMAIVCPDDKNLFVFKVNWRGAVGRREKMPIWSTEACFEEVWVANDGQHLIGAAYAGCTLPSNYTSEEIIFSFLKNGGSIGDIRLNEIISDCSKLEETQSGVRWGKVKGFNEAGYLVAETVENKMLMFDPTTGKKAAFSQDQGKMPSGFKIYRDVMNCFEFAYPDDYEMNEAGFLLKRNGTGWLIEFNFEDISRYSDEAFNPKKMTFEDFAIHIMEIMLSADGPDGSRYATDVARKNILTTANHLKMLEIYMTVVEENRREIEISLEGPLYAVLLSKPGDPYKVLFLKLTDEGEQLEKEQQILKDIVNTITILK